MGSLVGELLLTCKEPMKPHREKYVHFIEHNKDCRAGEQRQELGERQKDAPDSRGREGAEAEFLDEMKQLPSHGLGYVRCVVGREVFMVPALAFSLLHLGGQDAMGAEGWLWSALDLSAVGS